MCSLKLQQTMVQEVPLRLLQGRNCHLYLWQTMMMKNIEERKHAK